MNDNIKAKIKTKNLLFKQYMQNERFESDFGFLKALKVVSATFLLVCFVSLKGTSCQTRKNVFYFTSKALFVLEIIKF